MIEIYVSTDVECDGPIPGPHSMLSLASAAMTADGELLSTFSANLETLPGARADPKTAQWWSKHPQAWSACRTDLRSPSEAMRQYVAWLKGLPGRPVFVGYPAAFDFMFVYWYIMHFVGASPFGHSALDIKTFAMALLGTPYRGSTKRNMPRRWLATWHHTHIALDDAIEQGLLFCSMLSERRAASAAQRPRA